MLLYVAIVATLNLCAGYVLGAKIRRLPALLDRFDPLGLSSLAEEQDDVPLIVEKPKSKPAAKPAPPVDPEPAEEPVAPVASIHEDEQPPQETTETPDAEAAEAAESTDSHPMTEKVMEGLSAFQAQLADLGKELQDTNEEDAFDDCCERIQQANHEYLDHASDAIEQLADDADAAPVCEAVKAGAEEVRQKSDEFDSTLASETKDDEVRDKLRGLSDELIETASSVETKIGEQTAGDEPPESDEQTSELELPPLEIDAATNLATIDSLLERLDTLLADSEGKPPLLVGAIQADKPQEGEIAAESLPQLMQRLGELVSEAILDPDAEQESGQIPSLAIHNDNQLLVLLPGDSVDQASRRMELVRQQVEATTFVDGEQERSLTVSCGLAQSSSNCNRDVLQEHLAESLSEAYRYGGNRACHHDGKFPAPVMPEEVSVEPRTVTLA